MAFTTYSAQATAFSNLSVTGVTRSLAYTPSQVSTADMPLAFPRLPEIEVSTGPLSGDQFDVDTGTVEYVIVVNAHSQSTAAANYSTALTLTDNLLAALESSAESLGIQSVTMRHEYDSFGSDTPYLVLVATVSFN